MNANVAGVSYIKITEIKKFGREAHLLFFWSNIPAAQIVWPLHASLLSSVFCERLAGQLRMSRSCAENTRLAFMLTVTSGILSCAISHPFHTKEKRYRR